MKKTAPTQAQSPGPHALTIGPYRIWNVLGEGGMGTVYEAELEEKKQRVALKVLRRAGVTSQAWARFEREAEFLEQLDHPNIARVLETGLHQDARGASVPWIAMELIDGVDIRRHADQRQLDHRDRIGLLLQTCDAVAHAHARGIIHRDLKPDNILVDGDGRVRVLDFGVARAVDEPELPSAQLTMAGDIVGTLSYMSPEQAGGLPSEVDERSDLYALGVVAFELLSGRLPIDLQGLPLADALGRIRDLEADRLRASGPGVRRGLDAIVGKALEREPARRYASVEEFADDLRRYLSHQPIVARPPGALDRLARFARRNRPLAFALVGAMLTLTAAVIVTTRLAWSEAEARQFADDTASRALLREREALRAQYRAELAAARAAIDQGDTAAARRMLALAPLPLRGWEWTQLLSSLDESLAHWPAPPGDAVSLAFDPASASLTIAAGGGIDVRTLPTGGVSWRWRGSPGDEVRALSGDGRRALVLNGTDARLLMVGTGETVLLDGNCTGHLVFASEGRIVHLNARNQKGQWEMVFAEAETGKALWRIPMPSDPAGVCIIGSSIVRPSPTEEGIEVIDGPTGLSRSYAGPTVSGVLRAADGRLVLGTRSGTGRTIAWETETWTRVPWLDVGADQAGVSELAFSRSGSLFASTHADGVSLLRDGGTGRLIATLAQSDLAGLVPKPVLNEQTRLVAVADAHHAILIASADDGTPMRQFQGHSEWLKALAFNEDGSLLASLDGKGGVRLWDVRDMSDLRTLQGHESYVYDVEISPDGKRLASSAWDGTTRLWDLESGRAIATLRDPATAPYFGEVGWSPDGERLVSVHGHSVTLWSVRTGEILDASRLQNWQVPHSSQTEPVSVTWLPDGSGFLVGSVHRQVHFYRMSEQGRLDAAELWPMRGEALDLSPDGRLLATSVQEDIEVWDLRTGELVIRHGEPGARSRDLAFSPDGSRLAAVSDDSFLRIWSVEQGLRLVKVNAHGDQAHGLAWSPDGTRIATGGSDRVIRIWDSERGEELAALRGHELYTYTLDWSPDGRVLVSGSGDATVRLWDESSLSLRLAARHERDRLRPLLAPHVRSLLAQAPTASAAAEGIDSRSGWGAEERRLAHDLLLEFHAGP